MFTVKKGYYRFSHPQPDATNQTLPNPENGKNENLFTVHGGFIQTLQDLDILVTLIRTFATLCCI
jgi:hypothetical protein